MDEQPVLDRIQSLVEDEQRLWRAGEDGGLTDSERSRLDTVRTELDACWGFLRRRRAGAPDAGDVPENDLDGPEPEPSHPEHGVHDDQPAPDPGINPNVP